MPSFDLRSEVQELNYAEIKHLTQLVQDPVFIKFLRNKALELALEIALKAPDGKMSDTEYRIAQAHDAAYLRAYNDLLSDIERPTTKE